jgi:hypothetical protein
VAEQDDLPLEGEESTEEKKVEISAKELAEIKDRAAALETKLQAAEIERVRLEEQAKKPPEAVPEPTPRLTYEQLQEYVDSGQITQAQADAEKARQMREDIKAEVSTELEQKFTAREQQKTVQEQFDAYVVKRPDIKVEGTEDRRRLQEEYAEFLKLGHPNDLRTEVAAMRAVFGPLDRVAETTRSRRESHRETGGAGGTPGKEGGGEKWEKGLNSTQIAGQRHQVEVGAYTGYDDPRFQRVCNRMRTQNQQRKSA